MEKEKNSKNIMDYATVTLLDAENAIEIIDQTKLPGTIEPVSYTHLTLPTICSV